MVKKGISARSFVGRVKRSLVCSRKTKARLADELFSELLEQFGTPDATIPRDYAAPEEVARDLQQDVDEREVLRIKRRRKRALVSFAVLALALLIFVVSYIIILLNDHDVVVTERVPGYTYSISSSSNQEQE